jgi:hypothetical protein
MKRISFGIVFLGVCLAARHKLRPEPLNHTQFSKLALNFLFESAGFPILAKAFFEFVF